MKKIKNLLLLFVSCFLFAASLFGQSTLSIQGVLKKTDGTAVDNGQYDLTFKLYTVSTGGTAIWTENQTGVKVTGGIYSTALGSVTPFNVLFDVPYFLGVTLNGEELNPRTPLSAAPYALALLGTAPAYFGDIKTSFAPADHAGWVKLDGRAKTDLTTTQQARATALGIGANLPNDDNLGLVGTSPTKPLGSTGGSATVSIAQTNLPNVNFSGNTSTNGEHSHVLNRRGNDDGNAHDPGNGRCGGNSAITSDRGICGSFSTAGAGSHSHSVTVSSGGSGTALNVENPFLAVHYYMYLGL